MSHTAPWTLAHRDACMARGSHASAHAHAAFLRSEMADMVAKGYWTVLPYRLVRELHNLQLSPIGVVPQGDRRPRIIVDLTFNGVNETTACLAPPDAMQFGRTLRRLLQQLHYAPPQHGPVYMLKTDVADGYYRVWLRSPDVPLLAVAFPSLPGEEQLVAFQRVLPMGWTESAPYFCIATETIADLTNARCAAHWDPPRHHLETMAATHPPPPTSRKENLLVYDFFCYHVCP